jgi:hypothetical protein
MPNQAAQGQVLDHFPYSNQETPFSFSEDAVRVLHPRQIAPLMQRRLYHPTWRWRQSPCELQAAPLVMSRQWAEAMLRLITFVS